MTKRERVEETYRFGPADRPPFVPAVYEHKARLIGRTPSEVCRSGELLERAVRREIEVYDPDMITVGVDVYNVEAEALGCRVRYFEDSADVPSVVAAAIGSPGDLARLGVPDPERDGRMPLYLDAAGRIGRAFGEGMIVRGAVSGPFSMACALAGTESVLAATIEDAAFARRLVEFCGTVAVAYGKAFLAKGVEVVLFDSKATPAVASPKVFREIVLPVYRDLVMPGLKAAGARYLPLVIGGDTTPVLEELILTGATQFICDAGADLGRFLERCGEARRALRANVDARLVHTGTPAGIEAAAGRLARAGAGQRGFLLGCGVVAWDTDPAHVLALRSGFGVGFGVGPR